MKSNASPLKQILEYPAAGQEEAEPEQILLGSRIRAIRKARGRSLQEVADACGLSPSYLSQVERHISTPSIAAVHKIATALGVNFNWFFNSSGHAVPAEEADYIVRAADRWTLNWDENIQDQLLSPNLNRKIELLYSRFAPGAHSGEEAYSEQTEKAGVVLSGTFELWIGERHFVLQAGDSFAFDGSEPYRYGNPGSIETTLLWVITPPSL